MKTSLLFLSTLALSSRLLTAHAQTPATPHDNPHPATPAATPKTADQRAATYKGPKVVKDSKALGRKMIQDSKPAPKPVSPVKE